MKHAREDYNRIQDPENKIPADEPVFLIRAQDTSAAATVRFWAEENLRNGGSERASDLALVQAREMENWPKHKPADLPSVKP
jgi:hypothetical protein